MRIAVLCTTDPRGLPSEDNTAVARQVARTLRAQGHSASVVPMRRPPPRLRCDLVFNLCEGIDGDPSQEANVAAWLDLLRMPYTGSGAEALRAALDKAWVPGPAPRRLVVENAFFPWRGLVKFPAIVKPRRQDASLGIDRESVVRDVAALRERVGSVVKRFGPGAVIEEFIDGREFNVAVTDEGVLAISEIEFAVEPRVVTYAAKWRTGSAEDLGTRPVCPARVSKVLARRIGRVAMEAIRALGCRGYARVDLRMRGRRLYVLEVNPNPDLSRDAGMARSARAAGWSYETLIGKIVTFALRKHENRKARGEAPGRRRGAGPGLRRLPRQGNRGLPRDRGHRSLQTGTEGL